MTDESVTSSVASTAEFHRQGPLASYVADVRYAASPQVYMVDMHQPAGDMSEPSFGALVLITDISGRHATLDCGAGRFRSLGAAGSLYLRHPDAGISVVADNAHHVRGLVMTKEIVAAAGAEIGRTDFDFGRLHGENFVDPQTQLFSECSWRTANDPTPESRLIIESLAVSLVAHLSLLSQRPIPVAKGGLSARVLKRVQAYMLENIAAGIGLDELARVSQLSARHFCRAFKHSTGLSPHAWLLAQRMERAKALLATRDDLDLATISEQMGYKGLTAFGAAFKNATGFTPGQWRKAHTQ